MEQATFGAGCFWGVEETFRQIKGVKKTRVGYCGGNRDNPSYEEVCTNNTGHAEVVDIEFDPTEVSYEKLLEVFWANHDPTQWNRQGPDYGSQYRSVIFCHTEVQKKSAEESKKILEESGRLSKPVQTQIVTALAFYPAEEYHQQYLAKRGLGTCHL